MYSAFIYPQILSQNYSKISTQIEIPLWFNSTLNEWVGNVTLPSSSNLGNLTYLSSTTYFGLPFDIMVNGISFNGVPTINNYNTSYTFYVYPYTLVKGQHIDEGETYNAVLDYYEGIVIAGFSQSYPVNTSALVGVYIRNGSLAWIIKLPFAVTSSVGDAVPAVYNGYLVDGFLGFATGHRPYLSNINAREVLLITNATTGKILVLENVTDKTTHPSDTNNGYNPIVVNGTIYLPTIAGTVEAFNL
jgi:hypothetical protein